MALPITLAAAQGVGSSTPVECHGRLTVAVFGTHGGSTQIEMTPDDGVTFVPFGAAITANVILTLDVPIGAWLRLTVTTAGSITARAGLVDLP